jgi:predicted TIM-barrel fold metal-dependent hydrolase
LIIDVNTWIGHWPFRPLRYRTAEHLLKQMDKHGIDKAIVSSIDAMFYKNAHAGNEELHKETKGFRDRLIPFATLNPCYPGWSEDLRICLDEFNFKGMRLHPNYHRYELAGSEATDLIDATNDIGWSIQLPMRVADRRQRHPWDLADDLNPNDLAQTFKKYPQTRWMILNGNGIQARHIPEGCNVIIEFSRLTCVLQKNVQELTRNSGGGSLAFGTGMPFKAAGPSIVKLNILDEPSQMKDRIAWRNAAEMVGMPN